MLMIGIRQFFTRQNFPNPDSSKFSTVKILRRTVIHCTHNYKHLEIHFNSLYCNLRMQETVGMQFSTNVQSFMAVQQINPSMNS